MEGFQVLIYRKPASIYVPVVDVSFMGAHFASGELGVGVKENDH